MDHDLNIRTKDVQDPQVAIWQERYGIWADEPNVAIIGECKYLFNHEIIVSPCSQWHFLSQIFYRIIPFSLDKTAGVVAVTWHIMNIQML